MGVSIMSKYVDKYNQMFLDYIQMALLPLQKRTPYRCRTAKPYL